MENFNLKKYLAEGRLLKENQLDDFLISSLEGVDSESADTVIRKEDLIDMFGEDSDPIKDFEYAYDLINSGRIKNYTRDMGDYIINYQLSIEDGIDPNIRIIANIRDK